VVFASEDELELVAGEVDPQLSDSLIALRAPVIVTKMGSKGAVVFSKDSKIQIPSITTEVVCALGAGDAFAAAFCYGLLQGWDLDVCGKAGAIAGAIVAGQLSCSDAMPTLNELQQHLREVLGSI
jgi:5-dehydro-2-deoxygluconokinase